MGIRVFIVGYVGECEKSFFYKTGGFGDSLGSSSRGLSLKILFRSFLNFVGIRAFIVKYVGECEKSFFYKT